MSDIDIDIDHLKTWEGRQQTSVDDLRPFPARALAAILDHDNLPDAADHLPPLWHWLYFLATPRASATGTDGHPAKGGFLPPVPLPRRMWAAGDVKMFEPLSIDRKTHRTTTVKSVNLKSGSSGILVFVNLNHDIHQGDTLCLREEQNLVYREMPSGPAPLPPGKTPAQPADFTHTVSPDPVMLFRYSALTYNGHRIHYDRNYAVDEEFYPALVVHGPLLATLLMNLARAQFPSTRFSRFKFRAMRPTFDSRPFQLQGRRDGNELELWTLDHEGFIGMTATALIASVSDN